MSSGTIEKVVLIGASGNLGAIVLSALLESKAFQVTVLSRNSSDASFPTGVHVVKSEYSEDALAKVFKGQHAVISTVGASGFEEQKIFVDAAVKAGVKRFIPSELSANTLSSAMRELVPVFESKMMILDHLKGRESSGLSWTGIAGGPLFDWGLRTGFLGFNLQDRSALIWDDGNVPFSTTNQADLGNAVISVLSNPSETANQYLYISTITTTQNVILESLQRQIGGEWTATHVSTAGQIEKGRQMVSQGDFTGMFALVQASFWGNVPGIRSDYATEESLSNEMLGVKSGNIDEMIRNVVG